MLVNSKFIAFLSKPALFATYLLFLTTPLHAANGQKPMGVPVKAVPVKIGTVSNEISAVGTLLADESVMIRPEIAGRVTRIYFTEGQKVAAGMKLISIEPAELQAQMAANAAETRLSTQNYRRAEELYQKKFISQQALDDARGRLAKSTALEQESRARLNKTEIKAPFSGIVGLRQVSPGAYVQPGQDIVKLEHIGSMKLDFRIPETYLAKIRKDQQVAVRVDAYANEVFNGRIFAIEPGVDEKTRTVSARARIPNPNFKLRPGMFARVNLVLGSRSNAILVPEQAIVPKGQESFVFRVVDGKALMTKVEIGQRNPGEVEIIKGLSSKDVVVTDGQIKLQDGAPVMVMGPAPTGKS